MRPKCLVITAGGLGGVLRWRVDVKRRIVERGRERGMRLVPFIDLVIPSHFQRSSVVLGVVFEC